MSGFVYFIFSTPGVVVAFFAIAVWIAVRPTSRIARRLLVAVATMYLFASIYAVPMFASRALTRHYHQFTAADTPPGRVALVIFGAGIESVAGWDEHVYVANAVAAARVLEAVRVYRIVKPEWVISSGGNVTPDDPAEPSSVNMQRMLVELGVPKERIVLESRSRDSHDEAAIIGPMLHALGAQSVILVTSSVHMPRSAGAFRAVGLNVTPAIAPDPAFQNAWTFWYLPHSKGLDYSAEVAHEFGGIPYYWLRGWWK